jgi:NAD(P)-dependent dehydrogenase (short-subunit alcohol dehydrogenase family)
MSDIAVICGATGALGSAIVDAFVQRGNHVIAVARSRAEVTDLEARYPRREGSGFVTGDTADLTQRLSVDDLWERIDRIGVPRWVINATGGFRAGTVAESTPDDFAFMLDLNLASTWWSCRAAARRMSSKDGHRPGGIVNVSSRAAVTADSGGAAYAVAKAGVVKLTEVLASELKNVGVRVNCVLPWVIDTPANRRTMPDKLINKAVAPSEIAAVIAYLCSDAADAINGAAIPVYGHS